MTRRLERAILTAVRYLLARQGRGGPWVDWALRGGQHSDSWTTAYVGYKLRLLSAPVKDTVRPAVEAAAAWLLSHERAEGGWGYNTDTRPDADSTAHGILFLSAWQKDIPESAHRRLLDFQHVDGGFSTYLPRSKRDAWGVSHPDITPTALLALLTWLPVEDRRLHAGLAYVRQQRTRNAVWNSFWWDSFLYATASNLALLRACHRFREAAKAVPSLRRAQPKNAFEAALLLASLARLESSRPSLTTRTVAQRLLDEQQSDGSWKAAPILRLTRRDCFAPWQAKSAGRLFADPQGVFTTATVLEALCQLYQREDWVGF